MAQSQVNKEMLLKQRLPRPQQNDYWIYFLFSGDEIVYVGQSISGVKRLYEHYGKDWDSYTFIRVEQSELNELEAAYIVKFRPKYNKTLPSNAEWKTICQLKDMGWSKGKLQRAIEAAVITPIYVFGRPRLSLSTLRGLKRKGVY